ncbi:hypothetical protein QJS10_CPB22g00330 [Acorus calamus]|uniref:Uncharacterized protein n=1 Tax=Acorus calamus TaxID=4465 RepID=A0AAV9BYU8_ACOCL|nr:hypothetical protein QJS10_CPB22g00330 [Acorus calamus]
MIEGLCNTFQRGDDPGGGLRPQHHSHGLPSGVLASGHFYESLVQKPPTDMTYIISRAEGYIHLEEDPPPPLQSTLCSKEDLPRKSNSPVPQRRATIVPI